MKPAYEKNAFDYSKRVVYEMHNLEETLPNITWCKSNDLKTVSHTFH